MHNLAIISSAGVPEHANHEYSTRAPYTLCGLNGLMLGSFDKDNEKHPAKVITSYLPEAFALDALIKLSRPSTHLFVNRDNKSRTVIELSAPVHGLSLSVDKQTSGISLFGESMEDFVRPMRPVDDSMMALAIDGLLLRISGKLADHHIAGGRFGSAALSAKL